MINEYSEAIGETLEVLKFMEDELLNKIPLDVIKKLKAQKSPTYINKFDNVLEIDFDKLDEKTKDILAVLYRDYVANEEERLEFDKILNENEIKGDGKDYTIEIFQRHETVKDEFLPVVVENKSFIQRIFEKIFRKTKT